MLARILGFTFLGLTLCAFSIEAGGQKDKVVKDVKDKVVKDKVAKDKKDDTKKLEGVKGAVSSVDKKEGSFTISVEKKERKFLVTATTKFVGPKGGDRGTGKSGLSDDCMEKGYVIRVVPTKDEKAAAEVHLPNRKTEKKDKK